MIIYNITVSVEESIKTDWLNWMKTVHIPDVLNTGHFSENKICRVLNVDDEGATYSVQYTFDKMEDIEAYQKNGIQSTQLILELDEDISNNDIDKKNTDGIFSNLLKENYDNFYKSIEENLNKFQN